MVWDELRLPPDFPRDTYNRIYVKPSERLYPPGGEPQPEWFEFSGGWKAVAFRFRTLTEADEAFRALLARVGDSPADLDSRYEQEREVFTFFFAGLGCLDAFAFTAHFVGHLVKPAEFAVDASSVSRIGARSAHQSWTRAFPGAPMTNAFTDLKEEQRFKDWCDVRNYLAHRAQPARKFIANGPTTFHRPLGDLVVEPGLTSNRRAWLVETITELSDLLLVFINAHL